MDALTEMVILQRLLLITLIAGAIGFERERHGRAAGFRTHILVGVGSCLVMLTGLYLHQVSIGHGDIDPTRMAAQVISGIGFLGAGTILRFRASVRGLTTAASLWAVVGVGLAVGAGFIWGAFVTSVILIIALFGLSRLERAMRRGQYQTLILDMSGSAHELGRVRALLSEYDTEIRDLDIREGAQPEMMHIEFHVKLLSEQSKEEFLGELLRLEPTIKARWV